MKSLNRKILFYSLLIALVSASVSYSQEISDDFYYSTFWDFYSNNRMSTIPAGKGYTGIAGRNDVSGVMLNPASLDLKNKYHAHAEYIYKSDVPWLKSFTQQLAVEDEYLRELHPSISGGVAYRMNKFLQVGLLYNTSNSYRLDYGTGQITNEFGEILGYADFYTDVSVSSITAPLVFNYKNFLRAGVNISYCIYHLGFTYNRISGNVPDNAAVANFQKVVPQFGVIVQPVKGLALGLTFVPETRENVTYKNYDGSTYTNKKANVFPMKIGAGVDFLFPNLPLRAAVDYNYTKSSVDNRLKDRHDINAGLEYTIMKKIALRAGFFTLKDNRADETEFMHWVDPVGKYTQYFATIGGSYRLKNFTLSLAVIDSHIFSKGLIKQTIVNAGVSFDL